MTLLIDCSTGAVLSADTCCLIPDGAFTSDEWEQIENFSNSEISRIGLDNGVCIDSSEQLLQSIADALWGEGADTEWNSDTIQAIADALHLQRPDLWHGRRKAARQRSRPA
jgi:hypothetical protein